jgi:hypothetical protein
MRWKILPTRPNISLMEGVLSKAAWKCEKKANHREEKRLL